MLEDECGKDSRKKDAGILPGGKILVVGESQIKFMERLFCSRDRRTQIRVCFPGSAVKDCGDRLVIVMKREGAPPFV